MDRPVELWVRLLPDEGEKVLGHAAIDLGRRGRFASSVSTRPAGSESAHGHAAEHLAIGVECGSLDTVERGSANTVVHGSPDPAPIGVVGRPRHNLADQSAGPVHQSDWQTARPGEVRQLAASPARNVSEWRTATQPIPEVAEPPIYPTPPPRGGAERGSQVLRGSPDPALAVGVAERPRYSESPPPDKPRAPKWSPDRPGKAIGDSATDRPPVDNSVPSPRPVWSPER